jgi:hypothetical protein
MIRLFRSKILKPVACLLVISILSEIVAPSVAYALTGGPSQPEVQSFSPVGTSDMVTMTSGDFTYNIPLLDVGGYPVNITYNGGVSMDQEASWVGLGWNINPGVINRNMRGLPDDFNGDKVRKEFNIKGQKNYGVNVLVEGELFGIKALKLGYGLGISYNNYTGVGFEMTVKPSLSAGDKTKGSATLGLGITTSSNSGVDISPSLSFSKSVKDKDNLNKDMTGKIGLAFNSREGFKALTVSGNVSTKDQEYQKANKDGTTTPTPTEAFSSNGGGSISFTTPSYVPKYDMPMFNASISFSATLGGEIFGIHPDVHLTGYYSGQFLLDKEKNNSSYGYLYSQNQSDDTDLQDFNREKDGSFKLGTTPNLPLTNFSYDIYSVSGQGVGGMYRLFRNDVGVVNDPFSFNMGVGASGGAEFGAGVGAHGGVDITGNMTGSWSGAWKNQNSVRGLLKFRGGDASDPSYESVYFKQAGEKNTEVDPEFFNNMGGFDPVMINLKDVGDDHYATSNFVKSDYSSVSIDKTKVRRKNRQSRNQNISYLTASEASNFGLVKEIENHPYNAHVMSAATSRYEATDRPSRIFADGSNGHHVSEMQAIRPDGARYVYGIPAYNTIQHEVSFAVQGNAPDCQTGLVSYVHGTNNSKDNGSGIDNYYDRTVTPAYAHSYLLTGILSPDYSDLTDNGPSDDDLGSYTKINYSKVVPVYKWRVPFEENQANYNEGMKSIDHTSNFTDDKASYIYGEKELWYMHSIETKTHVADFILEDRLDGNGVKGEEGGLISDAAQRGTQSMKRLTEIRLYSKPDKIKYGAQAVPIKVVHFEYDYSLCTGIGNNASKLTGVDPSLNKGGKLTLKKIFFTYGNSKKGKLSPYEFAYNNFNPNYNLKGYDRWGNFKLNEGHATCSDINAPLSTSEYPYVEQDKSIADRNSAAWSLSEIKLPSSGVIKVDYEADDYAYVQDKPAMQMFKITGTGSTSALNPENTNDLMGPNTSNISNSFLYFRLAQPIPASKTQAEANKIIADDYIRKMPFLYFRCLVDLNKPEGDDSYEFVPGYAQIDGTQYGVSLQTSGGFYTHGWLKLKETGVRTQGDGDAVNPISKAAWQFSRFYLPRIAYEQNDPSDPGFTQILEAMASAVKAMVTLFQGFNRHMRNGDFGKKFIKEKSFIRLYNPTGVKLGGGVRVKRIVLSDEWKTLTNNNNNTNAEYGQEYSYTTTETRNGRTDVISSGVASYEPILGGDENPWRQPVFTHESKFLIPSSDYYVERPMGESFFPSPSVVYSKVTVKNLQHTGVKRNATGSVVHEFYTAKDYPTVTRETPMVPKRSKPNAVFKLLKIRNKDKMTVSQGYVVELNDMHGQQKAQWVYQEDKADPISGVQYFYKTKTETKTVSLPALPGSPAKQHSITLTRLDNEVNAISKNAGNLVEKKQLGVEFDMVADMRQSRSITVSGGANGNLDAFLAAILPVAVPVILPALAKEETRFRSASVTKIINRYGLIDKVVAHDLGSAVSTENLLYDSETGEVLLTKTTNQFDDAVYNFTYAAHWAYERMGPAYKNSGLTLLNASLNNIPNAGKYFVPGDELALIPSSGSPVKGWVTAVPSSGLTVIDRNGVPVADVIYSVIKVIRSGRRNQQSTPIGSVSTLSNPVTDNNGDGKFELSFAKIVNASAIEFSDQWRIFCDCDLNVLDNYNPYLNGKLGNWRAQKSYLYLTERTQATLNNNTSIRTDGIFKTFNPFWLPPSLPGDWLADRTNWTFTSEVTEFSPFGFELENRDALGRYSSAVYGYNNTLPMGVGNNARYRELAFDNFEDYEYGQCSDDHFSYKTYKTATAEGQVTETESHSGRRSIQVNENQMVKVKKTIR